MDCVTYMCFYSAGMLGLDVRKVIDILASGNKKRKAKNSYIHNGADKKLLPQQDRLLPKIYKNVDQYIIYWEDN